ncbi:hypothetical protein LPC08_18705 [Roseomonas sp. OT10]|uniref:hypothetical protein n=1 Tax=Roseomonas cutis TaxID=2897332 RepID=UPI001E619F9E|nr:hypothetical protein [Roseomonas sp. OT10]UFN48025.1 hypothetical protein LPC08_18705 [Roseomonas sp. OT10]
MNDLDHDDGLVHSHSWASEPTPAVISATSTLGRPAPVVVPARDDSHDDGLVHEHSWACTERGAMTKAN